MKKLGIATFVIVLVLWGCAPGDDTPGGNTEDAPDGSPGEVDGADAGRTGGEDGDSGPDQPTEPDAPDRPPGTMAVVNSFWLTARTQVFEITSDAVSPGRTVNGPFEVRVTLPADYDTSGATRYPVLYLLHGGAGGSSRQWTSEGGAAEWITRDVPLITVMPDGGKVGWYTDWVNPGLAGIQDWQRFHLQQLIPWVDATFRTIARKEGRAIAGLSMGGFGAIHYAQERPDLFALAASYSGALDFEDLGIRAVVAEQAVQSGLPIDGPFGEPFSPVGQAWLDHNPVSRAADLQGVGVMLYAGDGTSDTDVLERTVGASTFKLHNALDAAGVPHYYWMYGRPGPGTPWDCDGGHNFNCWNMAFEHSLPGMMGVLAHP